MSLGDPPAHLPNAWVKGANGRCDTPTCLPELWNLRSGSQAHTAGSLYPELSTHPWFAPPDYFFTLMCVKVLSHKYKCPQKPEELDPPVAGVPGDGELPSEVLSIKLGSFGRAVFLTAKTPSPPHPLFFLLLF